MLLNDIIGRISLFYAKNVTLNTMEFSERILTKWKLYQKKNLNRLKEEKLKEEDLLMLEEDEWGSYRIIT